MKSETNFKKGDKVISNTSVKGLPAGVYTVQVYDNFDEEIWLDESDKWYPVSTFELYVEEDKLSSKASEIIAKYRYAVSLIGKKVLAVGEHVTVESVGLDLDHHDKQSGLVRIEFDKHGYCVYVKYKNCGVPVDQVELIEKVNVKLNDRYTATVNAKTITVGCQTFPVSIIEDLAKAVEKLKK